MVTAVVIPGVASTRPSQGRDGHAGWQAGKGREVEPVIGGAPEPENAARTAAAPTTTAAPLESPPGLDWSPPSWDEVVRQHSAAVYRLAYRLTGNRHDAEDLTQDVFIRVFRALENYTPGTFEGWLHRITTNLFLDQVRRKARIRFDALPADTERLVSPAASPEAVHDDSHLDADVEAALASLPPDFRTAVVLCDIEEFSYEEIAATLGIKIGTVRSRIHRGRTQLRAALEHRAPRKPAVPGSAR